MMKNKAQLHVIPSKRRGTKYGDQCMGNHGMCDKCERWGVTSGVCHLGCAIRGVPSGVCHLACAIWGVKYGG